MTNTATPTTGRESNEVENIDLSTAAAAIDSLMASEKDYQKPSKSSAGKVSKTVAAVEGSEAEQLEDIEGVETQLDVDADAELEGDDAEADAESEDAEPDGSVLDLDDETLNAKVVVKIDGQPAQVKLADVIKGYQKDQTASRRLEQLATEKRQFEAEREQTRQARERYAELLPALEQQLAALQPKQPDFDRLYAEDPIEAVRQERAWRQQQEQLALLRAEQRYLSEQQQAEQARKQQQIVSEEKEKLLKAKPEWSNPERWRTDSARIAAFAERIGFTKQELDAVVDHRALLILDRAARYEELVTKQRSKPVAAQPAQTKAPPVLKAGSALSLPRKPSVQEQAKKRFEKSRSLRDAASVLENMLK